MSEWADSEGENGYAVLKDGKSLRGSHPAALNHSPYSSWVMRGSGSSLRYDFSAPVRQRGECRSSDWRSCDWFTVIKSTLRPS